MSMQVKVEHNIQTGKIQEIPFTNQEITELEKSVSIESNRLILQKQNEFAEKESRMKILAKLGLTEEEAKILFG